MANRPSLTGSGWPNPPVKGRCPNCGNQTLFLAKSGHVTCSWADCTKPGAANDLISVREPMFTIRAQDALGPAAVEAWATLAEIAARATGSMALTGKAADARDKATVMRAWQGANPDRVKWPD